MNLRNLSKNIVLLFLFLTLGEVLARYLVDYNSNFYALPKRSKFQSINIHPYGQVPVNSKGHFDKEWNDPKTIKRYAYSGDSVVYGTGAGFPFRITEYLDDLEPDFEHINVNKFDNVFRKKKYSEPFIDFITSNKIDKFIFMMNLNDISEFVNLTKEGDNKVSFVKKFKLFLYPIDKNLRGNSVLYTHIRYKLKNIFVTYLGLNATGYKAIELEPIKNKLEIEKAAINFAKKLNETSELVQFCVILLPYEMQISENAANIYSSIGIKFDESFLNFYTQEIFIDTFRKYSNVPIYFLENSFPQKQIGTFYVYNKGDRIDFNHPNREGQKILSEQISERQLCL